MGASTTKTLRLSHPLAAAVSSSFEEWGYSDFSGAGRGTLRYAVLAKGHHSITAAWDAWPAAKQDTIDQALQILAASGRPLRGSWLEAILTRMADGEVSPPKREDLDLPQRVARELVQIAIELDPAWTPPAKL